MIEPIRTFNVYEYCPVQTINPRWFNEIGMAIAVAKDDMLLNYPNLEFKGFEQGKNSIRLDFLKKENGQLERCAYIHIRTVESYE